MEANRAMPWFVSNLGLSFVALLLHSNQQVSIKSLVFG